MKASISSERARAKSMVFSLAFNEFYVEMSRMVTQRFDGDIDRFFILAAISVASVAQVMSDEDKARKYASIDRRIEEDYAYIKLLPLAEITGLPRTTVRRKVGKLMEMGYVERDPVRGYRVTKGSMADCPQLRAIFEAQLALVLRLFNVLLGGSLIEISPAAGRTAAAPLGRSRA